MRRYAANVDKSQPAIVAALRKAGASVLHLHTVGRDCPDLLVGYGMRDQLLEAKTEKWDKPTDGQQRFHREWRGRPVAVVRTPEEALRVVGVPVEEIAAILGSAQLVGTAP